MDLERPALVYLLIVLGIVILARLRAYLNQNPHWKRVFRSLGVAEISIITLLLGTLIFFGCLQIVLRNFFHSGIIWADPLMRHVVLWLGCLGGVMATSRMRHINIDILTHILPPRLKSARDKVIYVATALASSFLGMAALKLVIDEKAFGETVFLNLPVWVLQSILPIAFFLVTYRSVLNFMLGPSVKAVVWEEIAKDRGDEPPPPERTGES